MAGLFAERVRAQDALDHAVQTVRVAWTAHDIKSLVSGGDTILLGLPGRNASPPLPSRQAARLLEEYLGSANEVSFTVRTVRLLDSERAYAEIERRYVVRGTADEVAVVLFLGFRRLGNRWQLREIRVGS